MIQLKSALESLAISVGSLFLPPLTKAGLAGVSMAGSMAQWVQGHETLTSAVLATGTALLSLLVAFKAYKVGGRYLIIQIS